MDPVLNETQKLLAESARQLVAGRGGPKSARALRDSETGFDRDRLRDIAGAGWLQILVPENAGGLGLGATELALVLEAMGSGLMLEPVCAMATTAGAIADSGNQTLADNLLGPLTAGEIIVVPALQEALGGVDLDKVATKATADDNGDWRISGEKLFVSTASVAGGFLVNAQGSDGMVLCHVARGAPGVDVTGARTVDGDGHGTLILDDVAVGADDVVAGPNTGAATSARMHFLMLLGLAAEMLGIMGQALDLTLEYHKTRKQFGKLIGSFQALQHRAVDNYIETELIRALLFQVCRAVDEDRASPAMGAAVKARASDAALVVTKSVIQMHGAIGFTDEYDASLYLKRAMTLAARLGSFAAHRARYAEMAGIG